MYRCLILSCLAVSLLGCDNEAPAPAAPATGAQRPPGDSGAPAAQGNVKLEYDTRIETKDGKSTVYWTAKVPTGGWTMTLDQPPLVEERNTLWWARVYVTIEAPGPNDLVTQAFETLEGKFEADKVINRVEFSVRRQVKGVESQWKPMYAVVKTGPEHVTDEDKVK